MKVGISTSCYFTKVNTEDTLPLIRNLGADRFEAFLGGMYEYQEDFAKLMARRKDDLGLTCTTIRWVASLNLSCLRGIPVSGRQRWMCLKWRWYVQEF